MKAGKTQKSSLRQQVLCGKIRAEVFVRAGRLFPLFFAAPDTQGNVMLFRVGKASTLCKFSQAGPIQSSHQGI